MQKKINLGRQTCTITFQYFDYIIPFQNPGE